jgi:hypothetical protein
MYILILLVVIIITILFLPQSHTIPIIDTTPYNANHYNYNTEGEIHDNYIYNPDTSLKPNSYAGYDVLFAGLYKIPNRLCVNSPPKGLGNNIEGACIDNNMRKTGSVQKTFENCFTQISKTPSCNIFDKKIEN